MDRKASSKAKDPNAENEAREGLRPHDCEDEHASFEAGDMLGRNELNTQYQGEER